MFLRNWWGGFFAQQNDAQGDQKFVIEALSLAVANKNITLVKQWLAVIKSRGYSPETLWFNNFTLLHYAITKTNRQSEDAILPILELLTNIGISINEHARDSLATYPIITAARRGLSKVVAWLIERHADIAVRDNSQKNAREYLEVAIKHKQQEMINEKDGQEIIERLKQICILLEKGSSAITDHVANIHHLLPHKPIGFN